VRIRKREASLLETEIANEKWKTNIESSENVYPDKERVTSTYESNVTVNLEIESKLLLLLIELTGTMNADHFNQLLQRLKPTLGSLPFLKFYWFMDKEKAATWATIQRKTNLCNSSIKNCINKAMERGIIEKTGKQRLKGLKGGPRPTIVYLKDLPDPAKEIRRAAIKHVHTSQGFDEVYRLTRLLLEQLKAKPVPNLRQEVSIREITAHLRRNAKPGYYAASLVTPVITLVQAEGIRVWR
jgi:hypothetical protein